MAGKIAALPSKAELFGKKPTPFRPLPPAPPPAAAPQPPTATVVEAPRVDPLIAPPVSAAPVLPAAAVGKGAAERQIEPTPPSDTAGAVADRAREKFTFRFDSATLSELDEVWMKLRRATGKKLRKSWIVEAALRHVIRDPQKALEILKAEMDQVRDAV